MFGFNPRKAKTFGAAWLLLFCTCAAAQNVQQGMDPKYKEKYEKEFYEAQKQYMITDSGRANFTTLSATVNKARQLVVVQCSDLSKSLAQLLVNTASRKVKVQVYTEKTAYQKNAYYKQMEKYGVRVVVLGKVDFANQQTVVVVDDAIVFMGAGNSFTFMKGPYPRYMRESLASAAQMMK